MGFHAVHPEDPNWGNNSPDGKHYRRFVTQKYAKITFWLAAGLVMLVILGNIVLGPCFFTIVNERPSQVKRWILIKTPWMRISMWAFTAALLFCSVCDTNGFDPAYVAKRLGRQVVALMPMMYLLTLRPSPLPRTFYLHVLDIHKFVSRFVVIVAAIHGILYVYFYYVTSVFYKAGNRDNVLGILLLVVFVLMSLTGIARVRRRFYEIFYRIHIVGAWICLPMLHWHSRPRSDGYLLMCSLLLVYQVVAKIWLSTNTKLRVQYVSSTLLLIEIPKSQLRGRRWWNWTVASHVRLSGNIVNPLNWIRSSHPYTIASLPEDESLQLLVRPGDFAIQMRREYTVFGPHSCVPNYLLQQIHSYTVNRVLLVIGGAGIAFGAPMMRYLRMYGTAVRMVWVMRDPYDARVLKQIGLHEEALNGNIEIYYTGEALVDEDHNGEDETLTIGTSDACSDGDHGGMGTIRAATRHPGVASRRVRGDQLLTQYALYMANSRPHLNYRLRSWLYGYSMNSEDCCCADRIVDSTPDDRLGAWVMSCGNEQLSTTTREWAKAAELCYFADSFTL